MTEETPKLCAWCGQPIRGPHAVQFMAKMYCSPLHREQFRYAERDREIGRKPSGEWMQRLKPPGGPL
jgi:hypothetical protein